jgi:hypothetical protein
LKLWSKEVHIKHWMHAKEGWNVWIKSIVTHNFGDGVSSIVEWSKLPMGFCKACFPKVQPIFISHQKLVWHPVLIMALLVLGIGILQNILNLLVDVLDSFNELSGFFYFIFSIGRLFLRGCEG